MFHNVNTMVITGGDFALTTALRTTTAFEKLQNASAMGAMHDSISRFDPPKCHPNTRVGILQYLMGWIFGRNDPEALILWLYGPAGAGKSAILQTIAERCAKRKSILASFFFGRTDPTRNTFKPLIPTIACQIAIAIPEIRPLVELVIERDPIIFDKSIATQLQFLVIHPLKDLIASGYFSNPEINPRLIIIDGLDECVDRKTHSIILHTLADALRAQKLPLVFLIASRPEQNIQFAFDSKSLAGLWKSLVLDNTYEPDSDIRTFLMDSFQEIKSTHPHHRYIPNDWPSESNINHLIKKSSGQFIYASVVIKYISAPYDRPPHRLDVIMGLCPARLPEVPFAELDALYIHLLESCPDIVSVMRILCVLLSGTFSVSCVESLLSLQPGDVNLALAPLSSVINICSYTSLILLSHASFGDFLTDMTRSSHFHINILTTKENLISTCVSMLMNPDLITNNIDYFHGILAGLLASLGSLTDKIKESLMRLSLPYIWSIWDSEYQPCKTQHSQSHKQFRRLLFVSQFLQAIDSVIKDVTQPSGCVKEFQIMRQFHLSAFQPIFESEFNKYYRETELMHVVVLATVVYDSIIKKKRPWYFVHQCHYSNKSFSRVLQNLLQLSAESIAIDDCKFSIVESLQLKTPIYHHFHHLWTPIPDDLYAQTALKMLRSLCNYPPHHNRFRRRSVNQKKEISHRHRVIYPKPTHPSYRLQSLRLQRAKRHQYGVKLRIPKGGSNYPLSSPFDMCKLGFILLPECLQRSSKSFELTEFIRSNGKKVPFVPKMTQYAIYAMNNYLARTSEDEIIDIWP